MPKKTKTQFLFLFLRSEREKALSEELESVASRTGHGTFKKVTCYLWAPVYSSIKWGDMT